MIAATALSDGLVLVTGNTAHYKHIVDRRFPLEIENWREKNCLPSGDHRSIAMGFVVILDLLVSRKTIFKHPSCPKDAALYGADRDVEITGEMIIGSLIQVYCQK